MKIYPSRIQQYFDSHKNLLQNHPIVHKFTVEQEFISFKEGFIQIDIKLIKSFHLKVFEYYKIGEGVINYRYHVMDSQNKLLVRWDNAPHHSELETYPHHIHTKNGVKSANQLSLAEILDVINIYW